MDSQPTPAAPATDAGDLEHLVDLAAQAPTEFAPGMVGERVAGIAPQVGE